MWIEGGRDDAVCGFFQSLCDAFRHAAGVFSQIRVHDAGVAAAAMVLTLFQAATAGERLNVHHRTSCALVRYYVATYSESVALAWARSNGATDAEVETARRCLPGSSTQQTNLTK